MATGKTSAAHRTVVVWRAANEPLLCKRLCETPEPLVVGGVLDIGETKYVQTHPVYTISRRSAKRLERNLSLALTEALHNMFGAQSTLDNLLKGVVCIGEDDPTISGASSFSEIQLAGSIADIPVDLADDPDGLLTKMGSSLFKAQGLLQIILIRCAAMSAKVFAALDDASLVTRLARTARAISNR